MERCWVESGLCKRVCQRSSARRFACLCLGAVCGPYRGLDSDEALCLWYPRSTRRHGRPLRWCSRPSGATSRAPRPIRASADDGDPPSRRDASSRVRDSSRDSRSEKEKRKSCASAIIERGGGSDVEVAAAIVIQAERARRAVGAHSTWHLWQRPRPMMARGYRGFDFAVRCQNLCPKLPKKDTCLFACV